MNFHFDNYSNSLDSFLHQTCLSHSTTKTASISRSTTYSTIVSSSSSAEETRSSTPTISASNSSRKTESTSISYLSSSATKTDSEFQRTSTNSHPKQEHTGTSWSSPTFTKTNTEIIPQKNARFAAASQIQSQVYSAASTSANVLTVLSSVVSAAASSSSSVNSFSAVRARVVLRSFNDILSGNCGIEDAVTAFDEQPPDISSSPMQLSISSSSSASSSSGRGYGYVTGLVVGNFLFILAFGFGWFTIFFVMISCFGTKQRQTSSINNIRSDAFAFPKNPQNLYERFIASKTHNGMFSLSCILLPPTLTCSAAALIAVFMLPDKQQYRHAAIPAICVALGWGFILIVGFVIPIWKLLLWRNTIGDSFVLAKQGSQRMILTRIADFFIAASGEWKHVSVRSSTSTSVKTNKFRISEARSKRSDLVAFHAAIPLRDPYTSTFPRFAIVDVAVIVMLVVAEIAGYFVSAPPEGATSCVVRGSIICVTLGLHLILILKYRPVFPDRLTNYGTTITDILSIVLIAGAMSTSGEVDEIEGNGWMNLAVALSMIQLAMTLIGLAGMIWSFFCQCKRKESKKNKDENKIEDDDKTLQIPKRRKFETDLSTAMMSKNNFSSSSRIDADEDDNESEEGLLMEMSVMPRHSPEKIRRKSSGNRKHNISYDFI